MDSGWRDVNRNEQFVQTSNVVRSRASREGASAFVHSQHLHRLRLLHGGLARSFGEALSEMLHTPVDVSVVQIDQYDFRRFLGRIAMPACFFVLSADALHDRWMLDIDPAVLHPMIDRMLGGTIGDGPPPGQPLTEIEQSLAGRIVRMFLQECRQAWQNILELSLTVAQSDDNPRLLRILPDDEPTVVIDFAVSIGGRRGSILLGIPCRTIEKLCGRLPSAGSLSVHQPMLDASRTVEITLAETQIEAAALADLQVGDIIATETPADRPVKVTIDGDVRFFGKPGTYQGRKAVRLTEPVDPVGNRPADGAESGHLAGE